MTTNSEQTAALNLEPVELDVEDIRNAIKLIDHGVEQGIYKTWKTIHEVWAYRARLVRFVEFVEATEAAKTADNAKAADATTPE